MRWLEACYRERWFAYGTFLLGILASLVLNDWTVVVATLVPVAVLVGAIEHIRRNS